MSQIPSLSTIMPTQTSTSIAWGSQTPQSKTDIEEVASQFEGAFVSMLLKEMRSTLEGGLFGEESSDTYGAMFDMYLGQHLSDTNALGIRDLLMTQWNQQSAAFKPDAYGGTETNTTQVEEAK